MDSTEKSIPKIPGGADASSFSRGELDQADLKGLSSAEGEVEAVGADGIGDGQLDEEFLPARAPQCIVQRRLKLQLLALCLDRLRTVEQRQNIKQFLLVQRH
jgi:hypothetical protein